MLLSFTLGKLEVWAAALAGRNTQSKTFFLQPSLSWCLDLDLLNKTKRLCSHVFSHHLFFLQGWVLMLAALTHVFGFPTPALHPVSLQFLQPGFCAWSSTCSLYKALSALYNEPKDQKPVCCIQLTQREQFPFFLSTSALKISLCYIESSGTPKAGSYFSKNINSDCQGRFKVFITKYFVLGFKNNALSVQRNSYSEHRTFFFSYLQ